MTINQWLQRQSLQVDKTGGLISLCDEIFRSGRSIVLQKNYSPFAAVFSLAGALPYHNFRRLLIWGQIIGEPNLCG
jgi:hypothetical protein